MEGWILVICISWHGEYCRTDTGASLVTQRVTEEQCRTAVALGKPKTYGLKVWCISPTGGLIESGPIRS